MQTRMVAAVAVLMPAIAFAQPGTVRLACGPANRMFATLSQGSIASDTANGFDLGTVPAFTGKACTSDQPFFISANLPEGTYRVTVTLGGPQASVTTVRAESRRLMLEKIPIPAGGAETRMFDVNIRYPEIADGVPGHVVKRKPREFDNLDWDHRLTLEFNGERPSLRSVTIEPVTEPVVYLAGDSTVVDQDTEPWAAWGQMLPRFFMPGVVIANHAESGETIKSFVGEQRFAKIFSVIRPGDYLFLQFNHNDQKPGAVSLEDYNRLLREYVAKARAAGATPVLVTAMNRRTFDDAGKITNSLGGYPDAVRAAAAETRTALIDLNAMSKTLFEAMGPEVSRKAFMHYAANTFPNQTAAIDDDTHFNSYGAYELARCVVHGIRAAKLPLVKFLAADVPDFDPAKPDPQATFSLPMTPIRIKTDVTKVPQT
ncbi:rhamnogalacturonan acetylesterase [Granulicella sibirica]|uniref:Rhamnogalacturonan acetylesterase n=1 Tax=Granulicella sibirica TaxID=2479048 RepID=A0A4V1L5U4_9BACT|nr:rhamnogalacturonan acetylesterase [Granulicella sibirica]RXH56974.1 rhamnogalacturonan acetylesterase [Granulicella sibirica]